MQLVVPSFAQTTSVGNASKLLSANFTPELRGLTIDLHDPLKLQFIVHEAARNNASMGDLLSVEDDSEKYLKFIQYFLAALTIPEDQLWVNLSPDEPDRILPGALERTDMGRDLIVQDYFLKQLTASLLQPENETGKKFWESVYARAQEMGITDLPVDLRQKVWIVPDVARVAVRNHSAIITEARLKVMTEEDYLVTGNEKRVTGTGNVRYPLPVIRHQDDVQQKIRDIILPAIEEEVNHGEQFASLRQMYRAMILASWYKKNLRQSFLGQAYINQQKTDGIATVDLGEKQTLYQKYLDLFKDSAGRLIREEYDPATQNLITRSYITGGYSAAMLSVRQDLKMSAVDLAPLVEGTETVEVVLQDIGRSFFSPDGASRHDRAMLLDFVRRVVGIFFFKQKKRMLRDVMDMDLFSEEGDAEAAAIGPFSENYVKVARRLAQKSLAGSIKQLSLTGRHLRYHAEQSFDQGDIESNIILMKKILPYLQVVLEELENDVLDEVIRADLERKSYAMTYAMINAWIFFWQSHPFDVQVSMEAYLPQSHVETQSEWFMKRYQSSFSAKERMILARAVKRNPRFRDFADGSHKSPWMFKAFHSYGDKDINQIKFMGNNTAQALFWPEDHLEPNVSQGAFKVYRDYYVRMLDIVASDFQDAAMMDDKKIGDFQVPSNPYRLRVLDERTEVRPLVVGNLLRDRDGHAHYRMSVKRFTSLLEMMRLFQSTHSLNADQQNIFALRTTGILLSDYEKKAILINNPFQAFVYLYTFEPLQALIYTIVDPSKREFFHNAFQRVAQQRKSPFVVQNMVPRELFGMLSRGTGLSLQDDPAEGVADINAETQELREFLSSQGISFDIRHAGLRWPKDMLLWLPAIPGRPQYYLSLPADFKRDVKFGGYMSEGGAAVTGVAKTPFIIFSDYTRLSETDALKDYVAGHISQYRDLNVYRLPDGWITLEYKGKTHLIENNHIDGVMAFIDGAYTADGRHRLLIDPHYEQEVKNHPEFRRFLQEQDIRPDDVVRVAESEIIYNPTNFALIGGRMVFNFAPDTVARLRLKEGAWLMLPQDKALKFSGLLLGSLGCMLADVPKDAAMMTVESFDEPVLGFYELMTYPADQPMEVHISVPGYPDREGAIFLNVDKNKLVRLYGFLLEISRMSQSEFARSPLGLLSDIEAFARDFLSDHEKQIIGLSSLAGMKDMRSEDTVAVEKAWATLKVVFETIQKNFPVFKSALESEMSRWSSPAVRSRFIPSHFKKSVKDVVMAREGMEGVVDIKGDLRRLRDELFPDAIMDYAFETFWTKDQMLKLPVERLSALRQAVRPKSINKENVQTTLLSEGGASVPGWARTPFIIFSDGTDAQQRNAFLRHLKKNFKKYRDMEFWVFPGGWTTFEYEGQKFLFGTSHIDNVMGFIHSEYTKDRRPRLLMDPLYYGEIKDRQFLKDFLKSQGFKKDQIVLVDASETGMNPANFSEIGGKIYFNHAPKTVEKLNLRSDRVVVLSAELALRDLQTAIGCLGCSVGEIPKDDLAMMGRTVAEKPSREEMLREVLSMRLKPDRPVEMEKPLTLDEIYAELERLGNFWNDIDPITNIYDRRPEDNVMMVLIKLMDFVSNTFFYDDFYTHDLTKAREGWKEIEKSLEMKILPSLALLSDEDIARDMAKRDPPNMVRDVYSLADYMSEHGKPSDFRAIIRNNPFAADWLNFSSMRFFDNDREPNTALSYFEIRLKAISLVNLMGPVVHAAMFGPHLRRAARASAGDEGDFSGIKMFFEKFLPYFEATLDEIERLETDDPINPDLTLLKERGWWFMASITSALTFLVKDDGLTDSQRIAPQMQRIEGIFSNPALNSYKNVIHRGLRRYSDFRDVTHAGIMRAPWYFRSTEASMGDDIAYHISVKADAPPSEILLSESGGDYRQMVMTMFPEDVPLVRLYLEILKFFGIERKDIWDSGRFEADGDSAMMDIAKFKFGDKYWVRRISSETPTEITVMGSLIGKQFGLETGLKLDKYAQLVEIFRRVLKDGSRTSDIFRYIENFGYMSEQERGLNSLDASVSLAQFVGYIQNHWKVLEQKLSGKTQDYALDSYLDVWKHMQGEWRTKNVRDNLIPAFMQEILLEGHGGVLGDPEVSDLNVETRSLSSFLENEGVALAKVQSRHKGFWSKDGGLWIDSLDGTSRYILTPQKSERDLFIGLNEAGAFIQGQAQTRFFLVSSGVASGVEEGELRAFEKFIESQSKFFGDVRFYRLPGAWTNLGWKDKNYLIQNYHLDNVMGFIDGRYTQDGRPRLLMDPWYFEEIKDNQQFIDFMQDQEFKRDQIVFVDADEQKYNPANFTEIKGRLYFNYAPQTVARLQLKPETYRMMSEEEALTVVSIMGGSLGCAVGESISDGVVSPIQEERKPTILEKDFLGKYQIIRHPASVQPKVFLSGDIVRQSSGRQVFVPIGRFAMLWKLIRDLPENIVGKSASQRQEEAARQFGNLLSFFEMGALQMPGANLFPEIRQSLERIQTVLAMIYLGSEELLKDRKRVYERVKDDWKTDYVLKHVIPLELFWIAQDHMGGVLSNDSRILSADLNAELRRVKDFLTRNGLNILAQGDIRTWPKDRQLWFPDVAGHDRYFVRLPQTFEKDPYYGVYLGEGGEAVAGVAKTPFMIFADHTRVEETDALLDYVRRYIEPYKAMSFYRWPGGWVNIQIGSDHFLIENAHMDTVVAYIDGKFVNDQRSRILMDPYYYEEIKRHPEFLRFLSEQDIQSDQIVLVEKSEAVFNTANLSWVQNKLVFNYSPATIQKLNLKEGAGIMLPAEDAIKHAAIFLGSLGCLLAEVADDPAMLNPFDIGLDTIEFRMLEEVADMDIEPAAPLMGVEGSKAKITENIRNVLKILGRDLSGADYYEKNSHDFFELILDVLHKFKASSQDFREIRGQVMESLNQLQRLGWSYDNVHDFGLRNFYPTLYDKIFAVSTEYVDPRLVSKADRVFEDRIRSVIQLPLEVSVMNAFAHGLHLRYEMKEVADAGDLRTIPILVDHLSGYLDVTLRALESEDVLLKAGYDVRGLRAKAKLLTEAILNAVTFVPNATHQGLIKSRMIGFFDYQEWFSGILDYGVDDILERALRAFPEFETFDETSLLAYRSEGLIFSDDLKAMESLNPDASVRAILLKRGAGALYGAYFPKIDDVTAVRNIYLGNIRTIRSRVTSFDAAMMKGQGAINSALVSELAAILWKPKDVLDERHPLVLADEFRNSIRDFLDAYAPERVSAFDGIFFWSSSENMEASYRQTLIRKMGRADFNAMVGADELLPLAFIDMMKFVLKEILERREEWTPESKDHVRDFMSQADDILSSLFLRHKNVFLSEPLFSSMDEWMVWYISGEAEEDVFENKTRNLMELSLTGTLLHLMFLGSHLRREATDFDNSDYKIMAWHINRLMPYLDVALNQLQSWDSGVNHTKREYDDLSVKAWAITSAVMGAMTFEKQLESEDLFPQYKEYHRKFLAGLRKDIHHFARAKGVMQKALERFDDIREGDRMFDEIHPWTLVAPRSYVSEMMEQAQRRVPRKTTKELYLTPSGYRTLKTQKLFSETTQPDPHPDAIYRMNLKFWGAIPVKSPVIKSKIDDAAMMSPREMMSLAAFVFLTGLPLASSAQIERIEREVYRFDLEYQTWADLNMDAVRQAVDVLNKTAYEGRMFMESRHHPEGVSEYNLFLSDEHNGVDLAYIVIIRPFGFELVCINRDPGIFVDAIVPILERVFGYHERRVLDVSPEGFDVKIYRVGFFTTYFQDKPPGYPIYVRILTPSHDGFMDVGSVSLDYMLLGTLQEHLTELMNLPDVVLLADEYDFSRPEVSLSITGQPDLETYDLQMWPGVFVHPDMNFTLVVDKKDNAMMSEKTKGGIDLNASSMRLEESGDIFKFEMPDVDPAQLRNIRGFVPVILRIAPTNVEKLLQG